MPIERYEINPMSLLADNSPCRVKTMRFWMLLWLGSIWIHIARAKVITYPAPAQESLSKWMEMTLHNINLNPIWRQ